MKPVKLHMKNIGPYLDEKIDFSGMDNMFLIKGDTGAGKTFIFDALTFALYGALRGNRKDHEKDLKSRYASDEDESFVEFEFEAGGKRYFVYRTVQFEYKNRNGKISSKPKEVYFAEISGGQRKEFFGKPSEIDSKIQSVIGLDVDEFAQIILLPQGKFAEFLHKNSKERAETLKSLFPVDFYTSLTDRIKEKFDEASFNLNVLESRIRSLENRCDFSDAEEKISENEEEIKNLEKIAAEIQKKKEEIASKKSALSHELKDAFEFEENCRSLEELKKQENEMNLLQEKIGKIEKAVLLKEFMREEKNASERKISAEKNLTDSKTELDSKQKILTELEIKKKEMEELSQKNKSGSENLAVLNKKIEDSSELPFLAETEKNLDSAKKENKKRIDFLMAKIDGEKSKLGEKSALEISSELNENLINLRERKNFLENEIKDCERRDELEKEKSGAEKEKNQNEEKERLENEKLERTKSVCEELKKKKEEQDCKNAAFSASKYLKVGAPCPVCGSVEHPAPVSKPEGLLEYGEQIKTNEANIDSIKNLISFLRTKISALNQKIETCDSELSKITAERKTDAAKNDFDEISLQIKKLEANLKEVQETGKKLLEDEKQLENLRKKDSEIENELAKTKAKRETLEKSLGEPLLNVVQKRNLLKSELDKNLAIFGVWEKSYSEAKTALEKAKTKLEESRKNADDACQKYLSAEKTLHLEIAKSVFETAGDAKSYLSEENELDSKRKTLSAYKADLKSKEDSVRNGKLKNLKSSIEIKSELEKNENDENDADLKFHEIRALLETKKNENLKLKDNFEELKKTKAERDALEKKTAPLSLLSADLSGKNPLKLKFETWALSMYFEQVVSFASKRFFDISGGRFSFELKDEKASGRAMSGLDLKVFDSHSGKYSDPAELSGGETFEASISLALALTDVVQNSSGGIQLDSLFIDEGFGTLDPETLEKAMSVLTELSETKMIGMISHVSEMEDFPDIKSVLKVNKTGRGSTVSVIV